MDHGTYTNTKNKTFVPHIDEFKNFTKIKKFNILHLNIDHLNCKLDEIVEIVNLRVFDIISLNETKIDTNYPTPKNLKNYYQIIRRDRDKDGGGVLVLIRKEYNIILQENFQESEVIFFQLKINGLINNFESIEIGIIAEFHLYNLIFAKDELLLDDYKSCILLNIFWQLLRNNN